MKTAMPILALLLAVSSLSACGATPRSSAPGAPSSTDVNPVTGSRGGSGAH